MFINNKQVVRNCIIGKNAVLNQNGEIIGGKKLLLIGTSCNKTIQGFSGKVIEQCSDGIEFETTEGRFKVIANEYTIVRRDNKYYEEISEKYLVPNETLNIMNVKKVTQEYFLL